MTRPTSEPPLEEPSRSPSRLAIRVREVEGPPVVAVRLWLRGGTREESIPGQALVSGRLLSEGTAERSWRRIAEAAEDRGMSIAAFGDHEVRGLAIDALAADWEPALEQAVELALGSSFPADRCEWAVRQALGELASISDHPVARTGWAFLEQLYGDHPAGRPPQGDEASLAGLDGAACAAFHRRSLAAGAILSVAGRIDPDRVAKRAAELAAGLDGPPVPLEPPPPPVPGEARRERRVDGEQAHLYLGHPTVERRHPALPALQVLAVILGAGGGLSGRIPFRVREREGLAYSAQVETVAGAGLDPGRFVVYVGTAPDNVERAIACVREEIARLLEDGVEERDVREARSFLLGRDPFHRETARQWAALMATATHFRLPLDRPQWVAERLAGVDRRRVEEAARAYLRPDEMRITVGSPS